MYNKRFRRYPGQRYEAGIFHRGQEYRSRLEARWAEFFFLLKIKAKYEWYTFARGYVPDFSVSYKGSSYSSGVHIEIKPTEQAREECIDKFRSMRGQILITMVGDPPGDAFLENRQHTRWLPDIGFFYCDMCGIIDLFDKPCRCGSMPIKNGGGILAAAAMANALNFIGDAVNDFKEKI